MAFDNTSINELQRMAETAHRAKNFAQAKSFYICLIGALKQQYGALSQPLAVNFYKLGEVYSDEGNYEAARTMYHRATELWERLPGSESGCGADAMIELHRLADTYTRRLKAHKNKDHRGAA